MRPRKCSSSTYSAGMVASASSSKTKWPSWRWYARSPAVARSTAAARRSSEAAISIISAGASAGTQSGGGFTGPDGTFDGAGQPGGGPVAGQHQIGQLGARRRPAPLLRGRRRDRGTPLLHHPPGRRRRPAVQTQRRAHIRPDRGDDPVGVHFHQAAGSAGGGGDVASL